MALGKELEALVHSQKIGQAEFNRVLKDSKTLARTQNREMKKISSKTILKQRLSQLYCLGNYSEKDIASILMVSVSTIRKMLKDGEVLDMITEYQAEEKQVIDSRLKALRNKATNTLFELLDSDEDTIRLQATKDVLDRTGHIAKKEDNINITVNYEQQLKELVNGIDFTLVDIDTEEE